MTTPTQPSTTDKAKDAASQVSTQARDVSTHATQAGSEVKDTVKDNAQKVAGDVREHGLQLTHEATQQLHGIAGEATTKLREHGSQQTDRAAQQLRSLTEQARAFAEGRTDEAGQLPQLAQQATEKLQTIADRLESGGLDGAMDEIRTFARRKPGTFLLAAGVAGFLGGRVLRGAKAAQDSQQQYSQSQYAQNYRASDALVDREPLIDLTEPSYAAVDEMSTQRSNY